MTRLVMSRLIPADGCLSREFAMRLRASSSSASSSVATTEGGSPFDDVFMASHSLVQWAGRELSGLARMRRHQCIEPPVARLIQPRIFRRQRWFVVMKVDAERGA